MYLAMELVCNCFDSFNTYSSSVLPVKAMIALVPIC